MYVKVHNTNSHLKLYSSISFIDHKSPSPKSSVQGQSIRVSSHQAFCWRIHACFPCLPHNYLFRNVAPNKERVVVHTLNVDFQLGLPTFYINRQISIWIVILTIINTDFCSLSLLSFFLSLYAHCFWPASGILKFCFPSYFGIEGNIKKDHFF